MLLANRHILRIKGENVFKFLQGLITQDIESSQNVLATAFLNPKGRVMSDAIIYRSKPDEVMLDLPADQSDKIRTLLIRHKLRLPLSIDSIPELGIYYSTDGEIVDPRHSSLPKRTVKAANVDQIADFSEPLEYKKLRLLAGIPEGTECLDVVPIFYNFDLFNAISFNKGCYTGQELVTRTVRRGIVRKRLFVVSGNKSFSIGDEVKENGESIGTVISAVDNVALALLSFSQGLNEGLQMLNAIQGKRFQINGNEILLSVPPYI